MTVWTVPATVGHVHDGDTLIADLDLGWHVTMRAQPIRLARCNAPELATQAGKLAAAFVQSLVKPGDAITLVSHTLDKYGRVLADVALADGRDLTTLLIAAGHAVAWDGQGAKPVPQP